MSVVYVKVCVHMAENLQYFSNAARETDSYHTSRSHIELLIGGKIDDFKPKQTVVASGGLPATAKHSC